MAVHQIDMWQWRCDRCGRLEKTNRKVLPMGWEKRKGQFAIPEPGDMHYCARCCEKFDLDEAE